MNGPSDQVLEELLTDFHDNPFPPMTPRRVSLPESPGCATIVTGMRRTGKTYLLFLRMQQLIRSGVDKSRLLYIDFEDDRLRGMGIEDLRRLADLFYRMHRDNREKTCYFFFDEIQDIGSAARSRIENGLERYFEIGRMPAVQGLPEDLRVKPLLSQVDTAIYRDVVDRNWIPGGQALKNDAPGYREVPL